MYVNLLHEHLNFLLYECKTKNLYFYHVFARNLYFCHVFAGRTQVSQSLVSFNEERLAQVRARVGRGVWMLDSKLRRGTQQKRRRHGCQVRERSIQYYTYVFSACHVIQARTQGGGCSDQEQRYITYSSIEPASQKS